MLKNISDLGSVLNKKEQQSIKGSKKQLLFSGGGSCSTGNWCPSGQICKCDDNDCSSGTCINA